MDKGIHIKNCKACGCLQVVVAQLCSDCRLSLVGLIKISYQTSMYTTTT